MPPKYGIKIEFCHQASLVKFVMVPNNIITATKSTPRKIPKTTPNKVSSPPKPVFETNEETKKFINAPKIRTMININPKEITVRNV